MSRVACFISGTVLAVRGGAIAQPRQNRGDDYDVGPEWLLGPPARPGEISGLVVCASCLSPCQPSVWLLSLEQTISRQAAEAVTQTTGKTLLKLAARNLLEVEGKQLALHQVLADVAKTGTDDESVERHRVYYLSLANEDVKDWRRIEGAYGQIKWGAHVIVGGEINPVACPPLCGALKRPADNAKPVKTG